MNKLRLKYPVIVEGKYDKIKLSNIISSPIIAIGGFSFLNDKKKKALLSTLAKETKLVILTDSDKAGSFIRSRLKGIIPPQKLINVYTPQIKGKEKRKDSASAENLLGVEGINSEVLIKLLSPFQVDAKSTVVEPIDSALLWEYGLSGKPDSSEKRKAVLKAFGLPENLTAKAMIDAINSLGGKSQFIKTVKNIFTKDE